MGKQSSTQIRGGFQSVLLLIAALVLSACNNYDFSSEDLLANGEADFMEEFKVDGQKYRPIDLVWVIDNSGSMSQEVEQVRANFANFISSVKTRTDLNIAVISAVQSYASHRLTLPADFNEAGGVLVDRAVGSHDSLYLLASAMCSTETAGHDLCNNSYPIRGSLVDFFRADSNKVFVFVTDDNSSLDYNEFLDFVPLAIGQEATAFGFISLGKQLSPCQARPGDEYRNMALDTGGDFFNICETDWSQHFGKLVDAVHRVSQTRFSLERDVKEGVAVFVNGKRLADDQFEFTRRQVEIDPEFFTNNPAAKYTIKVYYK